MMWVEQSEFLTVQVLKRRVACLVFCLALVLPAAGAQPRLGNVILIQPDGASLAAWNAFRLASVGPDGLTSWDQLPGVAIYRSHFTDGLSPTAHGGGTVHAWGVKVATDSFGTDGGRAILARSGQPRPLLAEAITANRAVGYVQSGHLAEAGSAVFLVSHAERNEHAAIAEKLFLSGADVMLAGGEIYLLPKGVKGRHGAAGVREDGRDLIAEAKQAGYKVVYTKRELKAAAADEGVHKLLGVFAARATYNAATPEEQASAKLPAYLPDAPDLGEMTEAALLVLARSGRRFALVVEEEGADDFARAQNPAGLFEALKRADKALAAARMFLEYNPDTLLLAAADADAAGPQVIGLGVSDPAMAKPPVVPAKTKAGLPVYGVAGKGSAPFLSGADAAGRRFWFGISFSSAEDFPGGVVVRAQGLNSDRLPLNFDNTDVYAMMWETLFGRELPAR